MIKYLFAIFILLPSQAIPLEKTVAEYSTMPVYQQIKRIRPAIDPHYAAKLTESIYEVAGAFKIDPRLMVAILAQESLFRTKAINTDSNDYGIAQINHKTAKAYKFNLKKLKTDPRYSIWAAGIILKDINELYEGKEKDPWTRYNSSIPSKRKEYRQLVVRYL